MNLIDTHNFNIAEVALKFRIEGTIAEVKAYGTGHINDTYLLKNKDSACPDYLLQRVNHNVFKDVPGLMNNIAIVTAYLKGKMELGFGKDAGQKLLSLIPADDGKLFHRDGDGNYWRVYIFIPGSRSYDIVSTRRQAYEGGSAFGSFQSLLSDMDPWLLSETIVDFHNIQKRLDDFYKAVNTDLLNRAGLVTTQIEFIKARAQSMSLIYNWGQAGVLPKRVTHNDTKFNNILFDANDKAECVIDLDTVMPGYVAYDFGDAIRTIINTTVEDEPDLDKIGINIPLFQAYTEGYINETGSFLTVKEVESLHLGVLLLPYMQGVRFLTDYLQGDSYFKIAYPEHNLVRVKAQFELLRKIEEHDGLLREIILNTVAKNKKIYEEKLKI